MIDWAALVVNRTVGDTPPSKWATKRFSGPNPIFLFGNQTPNLVLLPAHSLAGRARSSPKTTAETHDSRRHSAKPTAKWAANFGLLPAELPQASRTAVGCGHDDGPQIMQCGAVNGRQINKDGLRK